MRQTQTDTHTCTMAALSTTVGSRARTKEDPDETDLLGTTTDRETKHRKHVSLLLLLLVGAETGPPNGLDQRHKRGKGSNIAKKRPNHPQKNKKLFQAHFTLLLK